MMSGSLGVISSVTQQTCALEFVEVNPDRIVPISKTD